MYGVKIVAADTETGTLVDGYLTAKQISNAINDATKGLGSTGAPNHSRPNPVWDVVKYIH